MPSTDIAVQIFVPVELENPRLLFERVRAGLLHGGAVRRGLLLVVWLAHAGRCARLLRRRRRERWADELGPAPRIAVAYAEFRDAATDLSLGDPVRHAARVPSTACSRRREHSELAWLVSRTLYGDLAPTSPTTTPAAAEEMTAVAAPPASRRRSRSQVRAIGVLSKGSLLKPFTEESPASPYPTPFASLAARGGPQRRRRARSARRRLLRSHAKAAT